MTKQDEKLRLRRRLQDQAVELAARNRWQEAVETNRQLISLGEDADTYNRLGKAYFELGNLAEARDTYQPRRPANSLICGCSSPRPAKPASRRWSTYRAAPSSMRSSPAKKSTCGWKGATCWR